MEYPEEIYATRDGGLLTSKQRKNANAGWGRRHAYSLGYEAGKAEQSDYIESMSSLESVLTDVEQLEGEDLPFVKRLIERTVRAVRAEQADPLAGYSNLTTAIKAGEPIDWERLDGLKVQCVHQELGTLRGTLKRDPDCLPDICGAWWGMSMDDTYINALVDAWHGIKGWTLYVEGDVPLLRKTADQLEVGTYFRGESGQKLYVGEEIDSSKIVRHVPKMEESLFGPSEWVVLEEYGPFPFPDTQ